ncbi:cell wall hydrolase [Sphingosinicella sp. BN140058]|uniref:cell wall hydrolase n=1 Tax=Sphingosinicella sp. BN140058 TaxID=1892855 RepID=UPI001FB12065|nr:cell wall hydrolase [Sphingosinicella sp. BN140058]
MSPDHLSSAESHLAVESAGAEFALEGATSGGLPPHFDPRAEVRPPPSPLLAILLVLFLGLLAAGGAVAYLALDEDSQVLAGLARSVGIRTDKDGEKPPTIPVPPVEPVEYLDVPAETAQAINAKVPFTKDPVPAAAPFRLALPAADQARAVDCLASAAWYEAGDRALDQAPVVQVVLNRLRHPAFPKSVCGVVYQGSNRSTGCQFSFTCDGSLRRRIPSAAAWERARAMARSALAGSVYAPVGWATHFHTDWVVPNWSSSVDKVAAVNTHLFFRWRGATGKPGAFRGTHQGSEPITPMLATLSPAHRPGSETEVPEVALDLPPVSIEPEPPTAPPPSVAVPEAMLRGNQLRAADAAENLFVLQIKPDQFAGTLALVGLEMCKQAPKGCTVVGFTGTPGRVLSNGLGRTSWPDRQPDFYYFVDRSRAREIALWNCETLPRPDKKQCMPPGFRGEG